MDDLITSKDTVTHIRGTHPYVFRSGQWARLLTAVVSHGRDCYLVEFPGGATDWWPVDDKAAGYEFSYSDRKP